MCCKLCKQKTNQAFEALILGKYKIQYFHCSQCGFLQTEEPYWLQEAYNNPINLSDTGILDRNLIMAEKSAVIIYNLFDPNGTFLDYAGGYGLLTRRMRDIGFDFYNHDINTTNVIARGFDFNENMGPIEMITTFESFEHFIQPRQDIERMLEITKNIFFSTLLLPNPIPSPKEWWYYALDHGQHISFYSRQSLEFLAKRYNLFLYSNGFNLHLFTDKDISDNKFQKLLKNTKRHFDKKVKKGMKSRTVNDMNYLKSEIYS